MHYSQYKSSYLLKQLVKARYILQNMISQPSCKFNYAKCWQ